MTRGHHTCGQWRVGGCCAACDQGVGGPTGDAIVGYGGLALLLVIAGGITLFPWIAGAYAVKKIYGGRAQ